MLGSVKIYLDHTLGNTPAEDIKALIAKCGKETQHTGSVDGDL